MIVKLYSTLLGIFVAAILFIVIGGGVVSIATLNTSLSTYEQVKVLSKDSISADSSRIKEEICLYNVANDSLLSVRVKEYNVLTAKQDSLQAL